MELSEIANLSQLGVNGILIIGIIALWRQNVALGESYKTVLERCITALVRVNDYLDDQDESR